MPQDFVIKMIRIKDHPVSEAYANHCVTSWKDAGFDIQLYDAVTPATVSKQDSIPFKWSRPVTETEKACFLSQYNLWKECYEEDKPYLILEHDAYLINPRPIKYEPDLMLQYFGQHSMEAVMFHPEFAEMLLKRIYENGSTSGPMGLVESTLGFSSRNILQSTKCLPHARYIGPRAPVRSVLDPNLGNTVEHHTPDATDVVKQAIKGNNDLFKIVSL